MVLFLQCGFCLSSFETKCYINTPIMLLFELLYVKLSQMFPNLSTATIMLIRGETAFAFTDQFLSIGRQCIFRKSDIPNHVSSMLMMFLFLWSSSRNEMAHRYRSTRHLSELAWTAICFTFL
jgi:hypothetical protein